MTPELSVIIPCLGRLDAFERLMQSFASQTLERSRFEVIVVDDGNDPPLAEAVPSELLEGVRLIRQRNTGPAGAKNRGMRSARGTVILFLNADALLGPTTLEQHLRWHTQNDGVQRAVLGRFDATPNCWTALVDVCEGANIYFPERLLTPLQPNPGRFFITCNISLPAQAVRLTGGFDERFRRPMFEDVEFGVRLQKQTGIQVWWDPAIACGHDHPMYLEDFVKHAWMMGHEWVRLARKHGPHVVPAAGGTEHVNQDLALGLLRVLVTHAEPIEQQRRQLHERFCQLDELLARDRQAFESAIEEQRDVLVDGLDAINSNEPSRGTMNALFGFSEWDTRRVSQRQETVTTAGTHEASTADIVVHTCSNAPLSAAELDRIRTYFAVSPLVGAVGLTRGLKQTPQVELEAPRWGSDVIVATRRPVRQATTDPTPQALAQAALSEGLAVVSLGDE